MNSTPAARVILVSNRLPVAIARSSHGLEVRPSSGGLASGLRGVHGSSGGLWVGWPGASVHTPEEGAEVDHKLSELAAVAVHLPARTARRFYEGVSNGVIWPLFHYLLDRVPYVPRHWDEYVRANEQFADVVCGHATDSDLIWVHDYQLMLVPSFIRKRLPKAKIGFFLHIPFPSSEVFRVLPHREQVLSGLLGADLIGFHTFDYQRHFSASLLAVLGLETELDRVDVEGRTVRLGVFPMGIDSAHFDELGKSDAVARRCTELRAAQGVEKLLLGVDRLDYTKGLPRKLLAIERLLERSPEYRGKIRLLQVAVPSREHVEAYQSLRKDVDELVGRINGAHSTLESAPLHYVYGSVDTTELVATYRAADVMLVTPLRDGMNLVAKEYVAARADGDGVLMLSEFAGAASELGEAVVVNPYDVEAMATAIDRSLRMNEPERRSRMAALRAKVMARPVEIWAQSFISALALAPTDHTPEDLREQPERVLCIADELASRSVVLFALDYDGTLAPLRETPEAARPDPELCSLLTSLAELHGVHVHVVSGRTQQSLMEFLGRLPIGLVAEHGVWSRASPEAGWVCSVDGNLLDWKEPVHKIFQEYVSRTPGARIEEKTAGFAWHYRGAAPYLGAARARELRLHLVQSFSRGGMMVLSGRKVVEVRPQGVDKGVAAHQLLARAEPGAAVVAMGDDRTDEDLFAALPPDAYSFCAGPLPTRARFRLHGPEQVRALLTRFIETRSRARTSSSRARLG